MAEGETLKLPKPLPGSDFLTFPSDRRWDLLGFMKSEDIEDIKGCEVGQDGHRYYLIRWKDSWKPESSLIYCEKLLQDFWSKRSADTNSAVSVSHVDTTTEDCGNMKAKDVSMLVTSASKIVYPSKKPQVINHQQQHEKPDDSAMGIISDVEFSVNDENQETKVEKEIFPDLVSQANDSKDIVVSQENEAKGTLSEALLFTNSANESIFDSPSKKGAPKRKARPPRQSVHLVSERPNVVQKKREKAKRVKEKSKKVQTRVPKILKTVSAVINSATDTATSTEDDTDTSPIESNGITLEGVSSNLKCMVCDKYLASQQSLMKHLLTHNNNHTCTICMKTFKSTHFLRHHMDKHNASYQYTCPVCQKKFKFKNNMRGHLRKHNMEKKFECQICNKKFIGRYNLKEHMKAHSDSRPYECDFCKKAYKDRGALNKHLLTHQEKKVQCEVCQRFFTNAAQLKRHMQFHFSWPGDSFKRKSSMGPDGEKLKHTCPHCDKTFNHYSNMNAHLHKKHFEKKIKCSQCPKMFAYQYELREHMFIHLGGQGSKFKCQFCEKTFQRSTTLKNHERTTHLGIKRFKCEKCGKLFGTKFNMKVHFEKLHNGTEIQMKDRRPRVNRNEHSLHENEMIVTQPEQLMPPIPGVNVLAPSTVGTAGLSAHSLLRTISTSDIIRNAISHIPELGYFPMQPHPTRGYQFYGVPPADFGVS